jgi:hypothetical protein
MLVPRSQQCNETNSTTPISPASVVSLQARLASVQAQVDHGNAVSNRMVVRSPLDFWRFGVNVMKDVSRSGGPVTGSVDHGGPVGVYPSGVGPGGNAGGSGAGWNGRWIQGPGGRLLFWPAGSVDRDGRGGVLRDGAVYADGAACADPSERADVTPSDELGGARKYPPLPDWTTNQGLEVPIISPSGRLMPRSTATTRRGIGEWTPSVDRNPDTSICPGVSSWPWGWILLAVLGAAFLASDNGKKTENGR